MVNWNDGLARVLVREWPFEGWQKQPFWYESYEFATPTTLTPKNIPDAVYERLKASAQSHRRSLNSEAIVCLDSVLLPVTSRPIARFSKFTQGGLGEAVTGRIAIGTFAMFMPPGSNTIRRNALRLLRPCIVTPMFLR